VAGDDDDKEARYLTFNEEEEDEEDWGLVVSLEDTDAFSLLVDKLWSFLLSSTSCHIVKIELSMILSWVVCS
jgi:hypothetical protein